jgi:hypothetical protein
MTLLDRVLRFDAYKEASSAPGWRGKPTRMRKSRTPFQGRAPRQTFGQRMRVEEFRDKAARDARFAELRANGARGVSKFSDVRGGKDVWCVVRP